MKTLVASLFTAAITIFTAPLLAAGQDTILPGAAGSANSGLLNQGDDGAQGLSTTQGTDKLDAARDKARERKDQATEKSRARADAARDKAENRREARRDKNDERLGASDAKDAARAKADAAREKAENRREATRDKADQRREAMRERADAARENVPSANAHVGTTEDNGVAAGAEVEPKSKKN